MKKLSFLVVLVILAMSCSSAQYVKDTSITNIIETTLTKDEAFDYSMRWVAQAFNSAQNVIEYSDKVAGTINTKGIVTVPGGMNYPIDIRFSLIIDVKDNKARLSFRALSTLVMMGYRSNESTNITEPVFNKFAIEANRMTQNYQEFLKGNISNW